MRNRSPRRATSPMTTCKAFALRTRNTLTLAWLMVQLAAVHADTLIPMGSVWKYLDDGSDQGSVWYAPSFDDSGWASGRAQLGYGNGDEATVVGYGSDPGNKFITTYFRQAFVVTNAQAYSTITLRLLRDDGAIVFLNGMETARVGMPPGPANFQTRASDCAIEGQLFVGQVLGAGILQNGLNVLAVEIHQASPMSTDISFDLELTDEPAEVTRILDLAENQAVFRAPATLSLTSKAANSHGVTKMEFLVGGVKHSERSMYNTLYATFPYTFTSPTNCSLSIAATDRQGVVSTASVDVVVEPVPDAASTMTLVGIGSTWKYLDDGSDQGSAWRLAEYNDAAWLVGATAMGHGRPGITTTTRDGVMTTYFRRVFDVPAPAGITLLGLRILRADGVKVYLNGAEVFRNNLPSEPVTSETAALAAMVPTELLSSPYFEPAGLLPGRNVLAVEMHQATLDAAAMVFDLELIGILTPRLSLRLTGQGQAQLTWPYPSIGYQLMEATSLASPSWTAVTNPLPAEVGGVQEIPVSPNSSERYYRLRKD